MEEKLTLGVIGTSLGTLAGAGGLAGLLGIRPNGGGDPGDRPVTRYEMGLIAENQQLKAEKYADEKAAELQKEIGQQAVYNASVQGILQRQTEQIMQLFGMTQLIIPNRNVSPGWGPVAVVPVEPPIVPVVPGTDVSVSASERIKAKA